MEADVIRLRKGAKYEAVLDKNGKRIKGFSKYRGNGVFTYRENFKKLGIPPLQFSTGETTLGRAKTRVEIERQRHINKYLGISDQHVFGRREKGLTFREVCNEYLEVRTPEKRLVTQAQDKYLLKVLCEDIGSLPIDSITLDDFDELVRSRKRKAGKRKTYFDFAKKLSMVMTYAYEKKYVSHHLKFRSPDPKKEETGRLLEPEQIKAIWDASGPRLRDQIALLYECMMRKREVLELEVNRFNPKSGEIKLRVEDVKTGTRTGRGRSFIASPRARERLISRLTRIGNKGRYFFSARFEPNGHQKDLQRGLRFAAQRAGIEGSVSPNDLRHSGITHALIAGADVFALAEYCGNSARIIQRVYSHLKAKHTASIAGKVRVSDDEE